MHDVLLRLVMWTEESFSVSGRFGRRLLWPHFSAPLRPGRLRVARLGALVSGAGGRSGARIREHEESLLLALQLTPQALRGAQRRVSVWHLLRELHTQTRRTRSSHMSHSKQLSDSVRESGGVHTRSSFRLRRILSTLALPHILP